MDKEAIENLKFIECLEKEFADIESKLAEYQNDGVGDTILNAGKKIKELQQQLAEKDKEITVLKEVIDRNKTGNFTSENVCNAISKFYEPLLKHLQNQTAIAELEKVKELFENDYQGCREFIELYATFLTHIDQRIKELKGEK